MWSGFNKRRGRASTNHGPATLAADTRSAQSRIPDPQDLVRAVPARPSGYSGSRESRRAPRSETMPAPVSGCSSTFTTPMAQSRTTFRVAAEREVGDVHLVAAEQRADVADDARLIVVLDDEQRAFERRFNRRRHQSARGAKAAVGEDRAFDPSLAGIGMQLHRDEARVIARARAARLDELDAALGRHRSRVHRGDAAR